MNRHFITFACLLFLAGQAFAGSIQGVVEFKSTVPTPKTYNPGKFKNICGDQIPDESLIIDNKGLVNVVITISGKKLNKIKHQVSNGYTLDQKGCRYTPHVLAIPKESVLKIMASDPTNHNIHTYSFDNDPINLMMTPGQDHEHELEEPETVKVECDLHKWMSAWVIVTNNPFFAISGDKGKFQIKNVPPGKYKLTAWHETLGTKVQKVSVGEEPTSIVFDFSNNASQTSKK